MYSGISQYGWAEKSPSWFWCTIEKLDLMKQQFPKMGILSIPMGSRNSSGAGLQLVKDAVAWCEANNVKAVLCKYNVRGQTEEDLHAYWTIFAREFKGNKTVLLFDLFNEPWASNTGWFGHSELVQVYECVIDTIRAIDPDRLVGVQSFLKHEDTMDWVRTNPVKRPNVVYVAHLYSHQWQSADWFTWEGSHAWSRHYINHDYEYAREVLKEGMHERFGFIRTELGLPLLITEVAFPDTEEGLRYGDDVLKILTEWQVNWMYHSWYSPADRSMTLLDVAGNKRGMVSTVNSNLVNVPDPQLPPQEQNPFLLLFVIMLFFAGLIWIGSSQK